MSARLSYGRKNVLILALPFERVKAGIKPLLNRVKQLLQALNYVLSHDALMPAIEFTKDLPIRVRTYRTWTRTRARLSFVMRLRPCTHISLR